MGDTEAPTSGITQTAEQKAAQQANKLTEAEFDFVNLLHQHYNIHGVLITADLAMERYKLDPAQYRAFMSKASVQRAVGERGINTTAPLEGSQAWRNSALSGQQIVVADTMLDLLDQRSYKKKLQDLGVTSRQWQAWLKEPEFARYLDENTQSVLKNGQHEAALAIMDGVSRGDAKMLSLYLEYTGRFVPKASNALNPVSDAIDAKRILQSVVEIVIDEVEDHATASRIADRLKTLMTAVNVTNGLLGNAVGDKTQPLGSGPVGIDNPNSHKPEIVPTRVLTPAMDAAVKQGIGMET